LTDEQNSTGGDAKRGWTVTALLAVTGLILVVEFVLPGFVAAGFSRSGTGFIGINGDSWTSWSNFPAWPPPAIRIELVILTVPDWLMNHSQIIRWFYMWQFRVAGGVNLDFY
jgi:hypothetical protein